jgi:membrane protease YdiL (CAAX protease family)
MQTTPTIYTDGDDTHRQARRGLAIYFAVAILLSAPIQAVIIAADLDGGRNGLVRWLSLIAALMFVPTTASVVARLTLKEDFSDVSFRFGGRRGRNAILQALVLPALIGFVAYGIAWTTGLIGFGMPPTGLGGWVATIAALLVLNLVLVSGEEIGWRGYMLTRLIDAGVPRPVLMSGVIWGLWHVPLFLWGGFVQGVPSLLATALLMVLTPSLGYVLARMRLETGSVWPAIALHAAWNATIQAGFQPLAAGASSQVWVGESGMLTALVLVAAAVIYSRGRWTILHEPPKRETTHVQQVGVQVQPRVQ